MKFASEHDQKLFLLEIGKIDELCSGDFELTDDMMELFIKGRRKLVPKIKDFRKSQQTKDQWRSNRYQLMKGIKRFHNSTKGKRMHRAIGRFLATRHSPEGIMRAAESLNYLQLAEHLKGICSMRVHVWIEHEYYHPLEEHIQFCEAAEEVLSASFHVESGICAGNCSFQDKDLDILARFVDPNTLCSVISEEFLVPLDEVKSLFDSLVAKRELSYTDIIHQIQTLSIEKATSQ